MKMKGTTRLSTHRRLYSQFYSPTEVAPMTVYKYDENGQLTEVKVRTREECPFKRKY